MGTATNLEILALTQGLIWFQNFLQPAHFTIRTDHLSLLTLQSLKNARSSKLIRYSLLISQFDFTITHIAGTKNKLADALSRRPSEPQKEPEVEEPPIFDIDPNIACISDDYFVNNSQTSQVSQISQLKSADRHRRRHAEAIVFAVDENTATNGEYNTDQTPVGMEQTISDQVRSHIEQEDNNRMLDTINLNSQSEDPVFASIINYLQYNILPADNTEARSLILQAENFEIYNDILYKRTSFERKRLNEIKPIITQI